MGSIHTIPTKITKSNYKKRPRKCENFTSLGFERNLTNYKRDFFSLSIDGPSDSKPLTSPSENLPRVFIIN